MRVNIHNDVDRIFLNNISNGTRHEPALHDDNTSKRHLGDKCVTKSYMTLKNAVPWREFRGIVP